MPTAKLNLLNPVTKKREIGNYYEALACKYLTLQGLVLLAKNSQSKLGELDLVMQDKSCIVFIEVRYRKNDHFGCAASSVTKRKQEKIIKAALVWLNLQNFNAEEIEYRFDILAITGENKQWIINAF